MNTVFDARLDLADVLARLLVAQARIDLLVAALDALVKAAEMAVGSSDPPAGWSNRKRADAALRAAIAAAKEVAG